MVKAMQHSLSRIEREYVVQHLADVLPALVLLHGNDFDNIPALSYKCESETIIFPELVHERPGTFDIRVFFRHEKRGMYFDTHVKTDTKGQCVLSISPKIFFHEEEKKSKSDTTLTIDYSGQTYSASTDARYPVDVCFIDPELHARHHTGMKKLADKIGFDESMTNYSVASYRLFEYLDGFRSSPENQKLSGSLFYIDNTTVLLALPDNTVTPIKHDTMLSVSFNCGKRNIRFTAEMRGRLPVNKMLSIVYLHIKDAQEEDKRFLYERLFKDKYLG